MTLSLVVTEEAVQQIEEARQWLQSISAEAERFSTTLQQELNELCIAVGTRIASGILPIPDENASLT